MQKHFKRVLSLVLLCAMFATVVPMQIFASECDTLGHDLVLNTGKKPTYTEEGWADYYTCTRCDYTTFTVLPALGEPVINDYATFIQNLAILEELASMYVKENPGKDAASLVIKYIRTGVEKYTSGSWGIMAGYEDSGFATYVKKTEESINASIADGEEMLAVSGLKNLEDMVMPNGETHDIAHIIGTMDITYTNKDSQNHADVAGWAGDLVDLLTITDLKGLDATLSFEEQVAYVRNNYLGVDFVESGFDLQDIRGDLDAIALVDAFYNTEYASGTLANVFSAYFTDTLNDVERADFFLRNRLDGVSTRIDVRDAVLNAYLKNSVVTTLESTEDFTTSDIATLRKICCYAFADYVCELAGDYVEQIENEFYDVFSTTTSVLAPGIVQKKHFATSADGKQMAYYTATADVTRDDVDLFANYNDTYPENGWAMARVLDQANAAQERYGNPESPDYIENYNVIVSTNGAGFNMQTGEPSGVLVMNGVEYHAINSNGFVGVLKDGTPVIGTTEEYNTIYKDQVRDAIAIFGSTLIKDGEICITKSTDYYTNRASRTAVGITKTGKVVLMVLDGRQEPFSCGGSMEEIAQIMFDAGCVEAVNLDGGGSTTFVAKQEGDDELSLVSSPSDGIQRSVSTSLMMVSTAPSSTAFDHAILETATDYMTVGSTLKITPAGVSATGNSAELPEGVTYALSNANWGSITEDGCFTASRGGSVDVYLMLDEEIIGQKTIYIITPDQLYFKKANIDAVYGASVDLPIVALYEGKEVTINPSDLVYTLSNEAAGTVVDYTFTASETTTLKGVTLTASLAADSAVCASISISLYNQGEASFDFDAAVGGDRQLAWDRIVSNSTTSDDIVYTIVNSEEDMVTDYIFAMDMTQIPIPERLADLTSMLPGSDIEGASAWTFLMQLAERISVLTEVRAVVNFDTKFNVDYSGLTLVNDFFELKATEFNEETNELTVILNWIDQTAAIDPDTANPLCIISGVKVTPKADADWGASSRITAVTSGNISYDIYMRASALYSFSQKPENQTIYGLYPFVNPNDESEKGGHFSDTYKTFNDTYTLVSSVKNGWLIEDGGYAYYVNGERTYGIAQVEGYYYDFGETGINDGQTKYTGQLIVDGKKCYSSFGLLVSGWQVIDGNNYYFNENDYSMVTGKYTVDKLEYTFDENGVLIRGAFVQTEKGVRYFFAGRHLVSRWFELEEGSLWANEDGFVCYGIAPVIYTSKPAIWYHFDETTGAMISTCDGFIEYQGETYWCDENGNITYGVVDVEGGKIFCATMGRVVKNASCYISDSIDSKGGLEDGPYLCDENGYIIANGFVTIGEYTYYLTDYVKAKGLTKIGENYYFFNQANGTMRTNAELWIGTNTYGLASGYYYARSDGTLHIPDTVNGEKAIIEEDGNLYFTIDGAIMKGGIYELDGDYYYASSTGVLIKDKVQWIGSNSYINSGNYKFGSDCKLVKTGFVTISSGYTYYYDDLVLAKGFTMIGDDYYFFNTSSGAMVTDSTRWISANSYGIPAGYYYFGTDGTMLISTVSVSVSGTEVAVMGLEDIRDCWISRGDLDNYDDVKANVVVRVVEGSSRITAEGKFVYDVMTDGTYTVYVRYPNGGVYSETIVCDTTTTVNKNIITVTDIDPETVRDINIAKGEYSVYADVKANKVYGLKSTSYKIVDGTWKYMVPENGIYTVLIRYNDGTAKYYTVECDRGDVATCVQDGNKITFTGLDNLLVLRYAKGEYTTSAEVKRAYGCINIQPYKVTDGSWSVELKSGVYTFVTQFVDGNQVFYTITVE